jgi:hypothetical protein
MPSRSRLSNPESKSVGWLLPVLVCVVVAAALLWPTTFALPPYIALQIVFRHVIYPLLSGEQSPEFSPHPPGIYFLVLTPVAVALLVALLSYLARRPSGTYLGRAASAFGLLVLAMYVLNSKVQGGLGIPLALLYSAGLLALCWEAQRTDWVRRLLAGIAWAGLGFFVSSGVLIATTHGEERFDLQRLHGVYGYLWIAAMGAYLIAHITEYEAKRETSSRNLGYAASAILTAAALTGVARPARRWRDRSVGTVAARRDRSGGGGRDRRARRRRAGESVGSTHDPCVAPFPVLSCSRA